jgi:signal transduction histidine kinase
MGSVPAAVARVAYARGPTSRRRPSAYDRNVKPAQNVPSPQTPPVTGGRSRLATEAVAWLAAAVSMAFGWLAAQQLRPYWSTRSLPDMVSDGDRGLVPTGTFSLHTERDWPNGAGTVLPALLVLAMIPLLRRRPVVTATLLSAGAVNLGLANPDGQSRYLYVIAVDACVWFLAARRSRRISVPSALIPLAGMVLAMAINPPGDSRLMGTHVFVVILMTAMAWLIGDSFRTRRENAARLRAETAAAAVTTERLRIARELHDMIAHSIGIIAIQAGVGSRVIDTQPDEARKALKAIEETSRDTLSGLRRTLTALRQNDTADGVAPTEPAPGLAELPKLVATTRHAGIRVDVQTRGIARPLPSDIDLAAYRIVQESLTNVVRHSGTHSCRAIVSYADDEVTVEVVDNGHGVPGSAGSGFGLVGMRERVSILHGDFDAGPRPGGGFRVSARLPIPGFATTYRTVKTAKKESETVTPGPDADSRSGTTAEPAGAS